MIEWESDASDHELPPRRITSIRTWAPVPSAHRAHLSTVVVPALRIHTTPTPFRFCPFSILRQHPSPSIFSSRPTPSIPSQASPTASSSSNHPPSFARTRSPSPGLSSMLKYFTSNALLGGVASSSLSSALSRLAGTFSGLLAWCVSGLLSGSFLL